MSGHGTIDTAVQATKLGAFDFIEKPFSLDQADPESVENVFKEKYKTTSENFGKQSAGNQDDLPLCFEMMVEVKNSHSTGSHRSNDPILLLGRKGNRKRVHRLLHPSKKPTEQPSIY